MDKPLLILDLDETLIYAEPGNPSDDRPVDFHIPGHRVLRRPYLTEFLETTGLWFELAVWSSASTPYVRSMVAKIFPAPEALAFAWSSDRCTLRYHAELQTCYCVKDLKKVKRLGYDLGRVLMVDDTPSKLERNYGNHLPVDPFEGQPGDTELRDVLPFLDRLREAEDVRRIEKRAWRELVRRGPGPEP
ncbi:NIF family HAD-type phosphatase [Tundrisphaera sp. TA3]|uniref:NIF family HAD-type phosphatase n=1 Tax=Tundrisphaera sp. TA3 TaxID=3435775 RepID=UPI003EBAE4A9